MDQQALERLGRYIVSRRVALGYRNRSDLANRLQFTVRTLSDIENGIRKASPGTYAMLENKLAWAPGSIDTILAGGEPKELVVKLRRDSPEPRYHSFTTDALSRASTEELLLELHRRIIRRREPRRDTWDDWEGLDSRGDWEGLDSRGDWPGGG
jgi:transcriptional regulator with XRE-family HTH domain